jgi:Tetratricopeptide repeat
VARCCLLFFGSLLMLRPLIADAQHCSGHYGFLRRPQPLLINPVLGYSGYVGPGYLQYQPSNPTPIVLPQRMQIISVGVPEEPAVSFDPSKVPVVPSSAAARLKSLEHQARGDQRLRQQKWADAWAAYRSSVDAAPDRAEAHLRLGMCLLTMLRYEPAIRELKRALSLDPTIPKLGKMSSTLFGPDSQIVRSSILSKLADWVQEDYRDPDRLFLLGVVLHFEGDPRGQEVFEAARRMRRKGDASHIVSFLDSPAGVAKGPQPAPIPEMPKLNPNPIPMSLVPPVVNLPKSIGPIPGAPVPMPDL